MSSLEEKAAQAKDKMQQSNPSIEPPKRQGMQDRIPMSLPTLKMAVPEIPGYHLHWMKGTPQRIAQAQRAGYEFVHPSEIELNPVAIGGDAQRGGNSDLGERVSIAEGSEIDVQGQALRMYLMKQKMEYWLEDQKLLEARNDQIVSALTAGLKQGVVGGQAPGEDAGDVQHRYVDKTRTKLPAFFQKKAPR